MKTIHIFATISIVLSIVFLSGCTGNGGYYPPGNGGSQFWEWHLTKEWNVVTFTQFQLICCDSDNPVDVLSSIDSYWHFIFEDVTWDSYWHNIGGEYGEGGTLQHIKPGILYYIEVSANCTLMIQKC